MLSLPLSLFMTSRRHWEHIASSNPEHLELMSAAVMGLVVKSHWSSAILSDNFDNILLRSVLLAQPRGGLRRSLDLCRNDIGIILE